MKTGFSKMFFFLVLLATTACTDYRFPLRIERCEDTSLTMEAFKKRVANTEKPVLVYFYAGWCADCRKTLPTVDEIEKELWGKLDVFRIDTERDKEITEAFNLDTIPLFVLYRDGQMQWIRFGPMHKNDLLAKLGDL